MGVNRSTTNTETLSDITLTVSPNEFEAADGFVSGVTGAVGVNTPNPTDGTFEISDVAVRNIGSAGVQGSLTSEWESFGNVNADYGNPQFYREGSRVYMDGGISVADPANDRYGLTTRIMTLPALFRPLKNELFNVVIDMSRYSATPGGVSLFENFLAGHLLIESNGEISLRSIFSDVQGTVSSFNIQSGWQNNNAIFLGGAIFFSGISFRCTD